MKTIVTLFLTLGLLACNQTAVPPTPAESPTAAPAPDTTQTGQTK